MFHELFLKQTMQNNVEQQPEMQRKRRAGASQRRPQHKVSDRCGAQLLLLQLPLLLLVRNLSVCLTNWVRTWKAKAHFKYIVGMHPRKEASSCACSAAKPCVCHAKSCVLHLCRALFTPHIKGVTLRFLNGSPCATALSSFEAYTVRCDPSFRYLLQCCYQ